MTNFSEMRNPGIGSYRSFSEVTAGLRWHNLAIRHEVHSMTPDKIYYSLHGHRTKISNGQLDDWLVYRFLQDAGPQAGKLSIEDGCLIRSRISHIWVTTALYVPRSQAVTKSPYTCISSDRYSPGLSSSNTSSEVEMCTVCAV